MDRKIIAAYLSGIGFGLVIAWTTELIFVGRGVISNYLGPVAIILICASILVNRGFSVGRSK